MMVIFVLIVFICLEEKTNLTIIKKYMEIRILAILVILSENTKLVEFSQYQKSGKTPFIIFARLESFIETIDEYQNNPEKSSTI